MKKKPRLKPAATFAVRSCPIPPRFQRPGQTEVHIIERIQRRKAAVVAKSYDPEWAERIARALTDEEELIRS